jgi:hypothetical protein
LFSQWPAVPCLVIATNAYPLYTNLENGPNGAGVVAIGGGYFGGLRKNYFLSDGKQCMFVLLGFLRGPGSTRKAALGCFLVLWPFKSEILIDFKSICISFYKCCIFHKYRGA